jgi:hypothetical protein
MIQKTENRKIISTTKLLCVKPIMATFQTLLGDCVYEIADHLSKYEMVAMYMTCSRFAQLFEGTVMNPYVYKPDDYTLVAYSAIRNNDLETIVRMWSKLYFRMRMVTPLGFIYTTAKMYKRRDIQMYLADKVTPGRRYYSMQGVRNVCEVEGCIATSKFGPRGALNAKVCEEHKQPDMIDLNFGEWLRQGELYLNDSFEIVPAKDIAPKVARSSTPQRLQNRNIYLEYREFDLDDEYENVLFERN